MKTKRNVILGVLGVVVIIGITVLIVFINFNWIYGNEQKVTCIVNDKWIKRSNEKDIYLVSCDDEVYKITDLFFKGKFNSSNIYTKLKKGKKYKLTVTGYRFGYFSSYQNINDYELIDKEDK